MDVEQGKLPLTYAKKTINQNTMRLEHEKIPLTNAKKTTNQNNPPATMPKGIGILLLRCLLFATLMYILFATLMYILRLVLSDKSRYPKFNIKDLTVSSLNIKEGEISANFSITFNIYNPKMGSEILYHEPKVSIFCKGQYLSTSTISTFHQKAGQQSSMNAILTASPAQVGNSVAHSINYDQTWKKAVFFVVQVQSDLIVNPGISSETRIDMTVLCRYIKVVFPSNGKLAKYSPGLFPELENECIFG